MRTRTPEQSMNVEVRQAGEAEQGQIEELLNDYLAESSEHREIYVGATNAADYRYLKDYWSDSSRFPFTLWANSELAGFAFVRRTEEDHEPVFQVAEFFVKPKYRRCGIGRAAVTNIWQRFPGWWELQVMNRNDSAVQFWERCISQQAKSWKVEEIVAPDGRRQFFHFEVAE
jgi:predicted acetyltransferase